MELLITIIALLIVLILQIIILANQNKNAKLIREFIASKAKTQYSDRDRFHGRRDNNAGQHRTNPANNPAKSSPTPQLASADSDNVEKSLRDINLKLKNAERDQEAARRKINDGIRNDQPRQQRSNRDKNRNPKDTFRRDRGNRNNWHNKNEEGRSFENTLDSSENNFPEAPAQFQPENHSELSAELKNSTASQSLPDLKPVDFEANQEHGRKFSVKRRTLEDTTSSVGQTVLEEQKQPELSNNQEQQVEPTDQQEQSFADNGEISFGRR